MHREGRVCDRAMFDFAIDSRLRGCDVVKVRIGISSAAAGSASARSSFSARRVDRCSSSYSNLRELACSLGWIAAVAPSTTSPSRTARKGPLTSARSSMPASSTSGRQASACAARTTAPARFANEGVNHLQADRRLRAVQILLGHTRIECTKRYLGRTLLRCVSDATR